jgi:hypothetical protein
MFILDTPPDTSAYMIAGYTIFFILIILYLISLFIRTRNLNQDLTILESIKEQSQASPGLRAASKPSSSTRPVVKRKATRPKASKSNQVKKNVIKKK